VAILRAVGLRAQQIFFLFIFESILIAVSGTIFGIGAVYALLFAFHAWIENKFGLPIAMVGLSVRVQLYAVSTVVAAAILGAIPAFRAYRNSLVDGLNAH